MWAAMCQRVRESYILMLYLDVCVSKGPSVYQSFVCVCVCE